MKLIGNIREKLGKILLKLSPKAEKALDAWLRSDAWHLIHPFDDILWKDFAQCILQSEYSFDQEELIRFIAHKAIENGETLDLENLNDKNSYIGLTGVIRDRVESLGL